MSKLYIVKDLHIRSENPFFLAQKDFAEWMENQEFNNSDNSILFLGDVFHHFHSSSLVNKFVVDFFENKLRFGKKIVLSGNNLHEYNSLKKSYAISILEPLKNIEIDYLPKIRCIENIKFLTLPFINDKSLIPEEFKTMKDYYENLPGDISGVKYDFMFGHIEDETINFNSSNQGINLSYLNCQERIFGHWHIKSRNYNLGLPIITRHDEKDQPNEILEIDTLTKQKTFIKVPKLINYYDVNYGVDIDTSKYDAKYCIFNVLNCTNSKISESEYIEKYKENKNIYFRQFKNKETKLLDQNSSDLSQDIKDGITVKKLLNKFFDKNNISIPIQKKIMETI